MLRTLFFGLLTACGAAPENPPIFADLKTTFPDLHRQVYGIYDAPLVRHGLHDELSEVYAGEALTQAYVEHWTTRTKMAEEDTSVNILEVSYAQIATRSRPDLAIDVEVDWSVGGVVTHRAHSHPRVNRYQAVFTVAQTQEGPRIVDTRLQSAERVRDMLSRASKGWILDQLPENAAGFLSPLDLLEAGMLQEEEAP